MGGRCLLRIVRWGRRWAERVVAVGWRKVRARREEVGDGKGLFGGGNLWSEGVGRRICDIELRTVEDGRLESWFHRWMAVVHGGNHKGSYRSSIPTQ